MIMVERLRGAGIRVPGSGCRIPCSTKRGFFFFFFFTLVTGPIRSLSLKLSDTRVYEPQIRERWVVLLGGSSAGGDD